MAAPPWILSPTSAPCRCPPPWIRVRPMPAPPSISRDWTTRGAAPAVASPGATGQMPAHSAESSASAPCCSGGRRGRVSGSELLEHRWPRLDDHIARREDDADQFEEILDGRHILAIATN